MTMMIKHIILATFLFGLVSCGQQRDVNTKISNVKVYDYYKPTFTVNQLKDKLEFGFKQAKPDSFGQIFVEWNKKIIPNSNEFINQNDTINALFNVYKAFYKPLDLLKLGNWEWGNNLNSKCKYVVVQNKIFYSVLLTDNFEDFDWDKLKIDSIDNFRPPIDLEKDKVLYLTNEYAEAINKFLGSESTMPGEGNIMDPSRPEGESKKRYEIIRPYIRVLHEHWGGNWHLETHPMINVIIFNKSLTKAEIAFRVGYQGGRAMLERIENKWIIKESKTTWIE